MCGLLVCGHPDVCTPHTETSIHPCNVYTSHMVSAVIHHTGELSVSMGRIEHSESIIFVYILVLSC